MPWELCGWRCSLTAGVLPPSHASATGTACAVTDVAEGRVLCCCSATLRVPWKRLRGLYEREKERGAACGPDTAPAWAEVSCGVVWCVVGPWVFSYYCGMAGAVLLSVVAVGICSARHGRPVADVCCLDVSSPSSTACRQAAGSVTHLYFGHAVVTLTCICVSVCPSSCLGSFFGTCRPGWFMFGGPS